MVPSVNKPLPETMMTQIYLASPGPTELKLLVERPRVPVQNKFNWEYAFPYVNKSSPESIWLVQGQKRPGRHFGL